MTTDFLIVGSGIAGLSLALKLSRFGSVSVITKKQKAESNTNYAQGGIAAVMDLGDNFDLHIEDTLDCGAGLCNEAAVRKIVYEGPDRIRELMQLGVRFSKEHGHLQLGREGGHSHNRIVHSKDFTGKEIERALLGKIEKSKRIKIYEYYYAIDLLTKNNFKNTGNTQRGCYGIYALNIKTNKVEKIISRATILATGGAGQVYEHTTNPEIATGDGVAMAYRAGCTIANMEFIQFHPTAFYEPERSDGSSQVFLISEAVRGAGAVLKTKDGKEFMHKYDKRKSLAPRDIVARAIDSEMKKSGDKYVCLDLHKIGSENVRRKFPNIYKHCLSKGIDITKEMIPVVPAAHYSCGGVKTDLRGRTSLKDLYASGEVAMTGVHGANRLASNSLLEATVFSNSIFEDISARLSEGSGGGLREKNLKQIHENILNWNEEGTENAEEWILISHDKQEIKESMSDYVGIVRNTIRLERAYRRINMMMTEIEDFYKKTKVSVDLLELRNLATVSFLIIKSAMMRKESRGLHYMLDYPFKDDAFLKGTEIRRKKF